MEKKALTLRRQGRYEEVITTMNDAIQVAIKELPKGHLLISKMYYTRGTTDHTLRKYFDARSYFDTALVYYDQASSYDSTLYSREIEYKYYAYEYSEGSQDTLIRYLGKLLELEEAKKVKNPNEILALQSNYPNIFIQKGDFEQALAYAIRAYKYGFENQKDVSVRYFAETQLHLARVLYYKKDFDKAIEIGLSAMPIVESAPRSEMPEYHSFNNMIGIAYMAIGGYDSALPYLNNALKISVTEGNLFEQKDKAQFYSRVLGNLGLCYINLGDQKKGKELLDASLEYMKKTIAVPSPDFHGNYDLLGDYYAGNQDWLKALESYDSALRNGLIQYEGPVYEFPSDSKMTYSYTDMKTLSKKAKSLKEVANDQKNPKQFLVASNEYVNTIHDLLMENRETFSASEGKLFLSENFKSLYENGIEVSFELFKETRDEKFFNEAMKFAKKSKSILFLEQSDEFSLVNSNQLSQETRERFFESKQKIEALQNEFYSLIDVSIKSDSVTKVNRELLRAKEESKSIKDSIETILDQYDFTQPAYLDFVDKPVEVSVGKALIEYFYGERHIYVFGRGQKKYSFQKVPITDELESALNSVIEIVSNQPKTKEIEGQAISFKASSLTLYETLVEPILDDLESNISHLIIVPDEYLSQLPFETLITKDSPTKSRYDNMDYLIYKYSIQYELSSAMLNASRSQVKAPNGLLAVGFKQSETQESSQPRFSSLPGTQREIEYLKSTVSGTFMMGKSGTKGDFLNNAGKYDILHLAVHGEANSTNRYESSLVFNGKGDNILNTNDLYLANINARLVVLSACESGTGQLNKGEGTFSIARGFSLVGVPSIVMSLWKVNDRITSDLMVGLYSSFINDGKSINESLRSAKLGYIEKSDEYSAHPFYWASFLQLGEDLSKEEEGTENMLWLWLVGLAFLALSMLYIKKRRA